MREIFILDTGLKRDRRSLSPQMGFDYFCMFCHYYLVSSWFEVRHRRGLRLSESIRRRAAPEESTPKLVKELAILAGGVAIGAAFSYVAVYAFYGGAGGIGDWGFPFVWKSFASASPEYLDYPARYEDVVFWLVVSVILAELWSHAVWPRLKA